MKLSAFIKPALALLILSLAGCTSTGATGAQPKPTTTKAPAAATSPQRDWQTYIDPTFGFHLDIPAILVQSFFPNTASTEIGIAWLYDPRQGPPPASQEVFAEIRIQLYATTGAPGTTNPCNQGTPITIGAGIPAYEDDTIGATPAPGLHHGGSGLGGFNVNLVTGGVFMIIGLDGGYWLANPPIRSADAFRARYGPIWQHILKSFVPGPPVPNTHPCG
jgi:hypothetical protein